MVTEMTCKEKKTGILFRFLLVIFVLLTTSVGSDQGPVKQKAFFWQIDFQSRISHILGSIHFLKKDVYPLPERIETAFEQSDFLVVEADISGSRMAENLTLTMQKAMYTDEGSLESNLSQKTYERAREVLEKMGMDIRFYDKFKPWFLAMSLSGMELMKLGFDPNFGLDKYFVDRASEKSPLSKKSRKEILELEGIEYQIDLFNGFSPRQSDRFLWMSLQDISHYRSEMEPMIQAWKNGDVDAMERILKQGLKQPDGMEEVYQKLVIERNHQMTDKIMSYLSTGDRYFIVVGAGHLVGDQGIVALLNSRGIQIKQL